VLGLIGPNGSDDERGIKVLAYDYPLLGMFWTFLLFFIWIAWIVVLFRVIFDIFRSKDLGGVAKALWVIFVIFLPFLGVLVYLIARGHSMTDRDVEEAQAQEQAFQAYVRQAAAPSGGSADELTKLADLRDKGVISDAEFQAQKAKLLA
jgi:Short C-terminal domain/Phospholipase_D-nuclease N-terminal